MGGCFDDEGIVAWLTGYTGMQPSRPMTRRGVSQWPRRTELPAAPSGAGLFKILNCRRWNPGPGGVGVTCRQGEVETSDRLPTRLPEITRGSSNSGACRSIVDRDFRRISLRHVQDVHDLRCRSLAVIMTREGYFTAYYLE